MGAAARPQTTTCTTVNVVTLHAIRNSAAVRPTRESPAGLVLARSIFTSRDMSQFGLGIGLPQHFVGSIDERY